MLSESRGAVVRGDYNLLVASAIRAVRRVPLCDLFLVGPLRVASAVLFIALVDFLYGRSGLR